MKTHTKEFQENLTPELAYEVLVEGNKRFISNLKVNRNLLQQLNDTQHAQYPFAVALSCMDEILERSSILRSLYRDGKIGVVGGMPILSAIPPV